MEILSAEPIPVTRGRPKGAVAQIRERHHLRARLVAEGRSYAQVGRLLGMTGAGVKAWAENPANAELIAQYAEDAKAGQATFLAESSERLNHNALLALDELNRRLRDDPGGLSTKDLLALAADANDRTGLGRMETRLNVNADLGTRLDRAIERAKEAGRTRLGPFGAGRLIELEVERRA